MYVALIALLSLSATFAFCGASCTMPSITTVSGTHAPQRRICPGDLIFEDDFDRLDLKVWNHEQTLAGGGNWEFQWYNNNRTNSYAENGTLFLQPTLLSDDRGENFLYSGTLDVNGGGPADECTDPRWWGCSRTGNRVNILNPIKSARIRTVHSFSFRYGVLEVKAKLPRGDWLWPAIWLLPRDNQYSYWVASGEIDLMESRGNKDLKKPDGGDIGNSLVSSTLHWGPDAQHNLYPLTHYETYNAEGFDQHFHTYRMVWSDTNITFFVDDKPHGAVAPPEGGFWSLGNLTDSGLHNPWRGGTTMAPFDQEFYIIMNVACGGMNFFPDDAVNGNGNKPWLNNSTRAAGDFWEGRKQWLPTWDLKTGESALQVDYVKVWAL